MRDIDREPRPFPRIPGTISEETLKVLIENAQIQGWHSLADEALQRAFIGVRLPIVKFVLSEYARNGQRAIEEALDEIHFKYTPIGAGFSNEELEEMHRAILQYELNKIRKQEAPRQELYPYTNDGQKFVAIRTRVSPVPNLAPLPHPFSTQVIANLIENPDFKFSVDEAYEIASRRKPTTGGSIKDLIDILKANLDVMNKLFGFGKRVRFQDGVYSVMEIVEAAPKAT